MRDRRGVLMLMYDVPSKSAVERREYTHFRKAILQEGFIQLQESVYVRLYRNYSYACTDVERIRSIAPEGGSVQLLPLSLNNFSSLITVRGSAFDMSMFSDDVVWL